MNGVDTTYATHLDVVSVIKKAGGTLQMKVIVPAQKPKSKSSTDTLKSPKNNEPKSSPKKDEKEQDKIDERKKNKDETSQKNKKMSAISKAASSPTSSKLSNRPEQLEKPSTQKSISENTTNQRKQEPATTTMEETTDSKQIPLSSTPTGAISRISPKNRSKKGNESPINQSPLLHSIRYEDKKQPDKSSLKNEVSDQPNTKENSKAKETKMNEETNKEEEELSEFAKQLRKAAMNRNDRVSAEKPKVTKTSKTNQTKKNDEFGSHIVSLEQKGMQKTTDNDIQLVNHTSSNNKESKPKENKTSTSAKEQKGVFPFSSGNNSGAVSPSWGGSSNYDDNDSDDGWTEVAPDDMKDFNVSTSSDRNSPSQLLKSPQTENTMTKSSVSPTSTSIKKKESKSQTSNNESSSNKPNTVKPSKSNAAHSKSPENTNSISLKQKSNKNSTKTHKPSTSKPPPVAEKPSRKKPKVISTENDQDKEKDKIKLKSVEKPDNNQTENEGVEEESAVTFPVLSLKHKFESMSSGSPKLATNKPDDSHVKSPLLPLSSKKKTTFGESNFQNSANNSLSYRSSPQTVGKTDSTKPTAKSEKKIIRVTNELPPPLDTGNCNYLFLFIIVVVVVFQL